MLQAALSARVPAVARRCAANHAARWPRLCIVPGVPSSAEMHKCMSSSAAQGRRVAHLPHKPGSSPPAPHSRPRHPPSPSAACGPRGPPAPSVRRCARLWLPPRLRRRRPRRRPRRRSSSSSPSARSAGSSVVRSLILWHDRDVRCKAGPTGKALQACRPTVPPAHTASCRLAPAHPATCSLCWPCPHPVSV